MATFCKVFAMLQTGFVFFFSLTDIVSKRIAHFILLHEDVSLQYFIPALA